MSIVFSKKNNQPFIIAGPCSAESEYQVLETARRLVKDTRVNMIRAGIWKPRTRPGSFEGVGEVGLPWMEKVKAETRLPVTIEVANARHVEKALKHNIDVLWIGSRTTVNPFAVQDIADALKGVDIPIMVKNPMNPDLGLWIGAIERFLKAGIENIAAIHRGFSNSTEKVYRNSPMWQIPIALKAEFPEMMMINDPSHICGNRTLLHSISQKAYDLNFDGLMVETHITPDEAWSDARQQITPAVFIEMLDNLIIRDTVIQDESQLEKLRKQIDNIDDEIINLISNRMGLVREIGAFKKENNIAIFQEKRWKEILQKFETNAQNHNISEKFMTEFIKTIHDESINQQENVFSEK